MPDLTRGSIRGHLVATGIPIAIGMVFQTLYYLVDLYFVGRLGAAALAGLLAAGSIYLFVLGPVQMLTAGTVALIAQAVGRKDTAAADLVFNQALSLAGLCVVVTVLAGYTLTASFMRSVAADDPTARAGIEYLYWLMPGLALQFPLVAMSAALRGIGVVKPTMAVQILTVIVNVALAPILIAGWATHFPMGVAGAGLASTIAIAGGTLVLGIYFKKLNRVLTFERRELRPLARTWGQIAAIGLPTGGEYMLLFVVSAIIYRAIHDFGPDAQAGFGAAWRVMQGLFPPVMGLAFAVAPIVGQNFGAQQPARIRETFHAAAMLALVIMVLLTIVCQAVPDRLLTPFVADIQALEAGKTFLRIASWNFVPSGIIFVCSGLFQGLGNTWPTLLASGSRVVVLAIAASWLTLSPRFTPKWLWYASALTVFLQMTVALLLATRELQRKCGIKLQVVPTG